MKKAIIIIFSYALFALAICMCVTAFAGHLPLLLDIHKSSYTVIRGFLAYMRILPAVLCSGFLTAFAIVFGTDAEKAQMRFSRVIMKHFRSVMIISIGLVFIITLSEEVASPILKKKKSYLEDAPHLLSEYIRLGRECLREENYTLAHRYGTQILKIKPASVEGKEFIDRSEAVLKAIKKAPLQEVVSVQEVMPLLEAKNETVTSLINKAKKCAERESWFEVHYYSQLAVAAGSELDINIKEAKRLASVAWNNLQKSPVSEKTREQELFAKKRAAYTALSKGDNVDAYYQFLEIAAEDEMWSSDPDVNQFLEIAKSRVESQCFFIDETEKLQVFENYRDVHFAIKHESGVTDVVYIRGITPMENGGKMVQYLRGLSVTTFGKNGNFIKSYSVPYAKMLSVDVNTFDESTRQALDIKKEYKRLPYIMLESISRNMRGKRIVPEYEFTSYIKPENQRRDNFSVLAISMDDFNTCCAAGDGIDKMTLNALLKCSDKASSFGYSSEIAGTNLIKRITYPMLMLLILVFLASVAWNFRVSKDTMFKFTWVFAMPVCTVICDVLIQIVITISSLTDFVLLAVAGSGAMLVSIFVIVCLLFLAAFHFALRKY